MSIDTPTAKPQREAKEVQVQVCNQICCRLNYNRVNFNFPKAFFLIIYYNFPEFLNCIQLILHFNSICLPMEALDPLDYTYLITVLAVNGLGFFIVVICYAQIYFSLGTETRTRSASSGEMTVAKKMALLVS